METAADTTQPHTSSATTFIVVFGDLRGWNTRTALRHHTGAGEQSPATFGHGFATVHIGPDTAYGPVVHDTTSPDGQRTLIVYAGRRQPEWVTQPELAAFGWTPTDDLPDAIQFGYEEIDLLLLSFDDHGHLDGWTRTVWLPATPRPMQRLRLQLGDGHGPRLDVRILEIGDEVQTEGAVTPFVIADADIPRFAADTLNSFGWSEEAWVNPRRDTWWGLHRLAQAIETKSATVLGFSMTTEVIVHNPDGLEPTALPLLPRDVQGALRAALNTTND